MVESMGRWKVDQKAEKKAVLWVVGLELLLVVRKVLSMVVLMVVLMVALKAV